VFACRLAASAALAALFWWRAEADAVVVSLYTGLQGAWWFQHDSFEPVLATM